MRLAGPIDLPAHRAPGGSDHAAIHHRDDRLYLAHGANAAVDIVDCARERYRGSIEDLPAGDGLALLARAVGADVIPPRRRSGTRSRQGEPARVR